MDYELELPFVATWSAMDGDILQSGFSSDFRGARGALTAAWSCLINSKLGSDRIRQLIARKDLLDAKDALVRVYKEYGLSADDISARLDVISAILVTAVSNQMRMAAAIQEARGQEPHTIRMDAELLAETRSLLALDLGVHREGEQDGGRTIAHP